MKIDYENVTTLGTVLITCDELGDAAPCVGQTFCHNGIGTQFRITSIKRHDAVLCVWPPVPPAYVCGVEQC